MANDASWNPQAAGNFQLSAIARTLQGAPIVPGSTELGWDLPTQNTGATKLIDLKTFKVYYGRSSGTYTNVVNLSATARKAALTYKISGLVGGTALAANDNVYARVTAVDANDNESVQSDEIALTALAEPTPNYSTFTEISSLPFTINSPGNYKVVGNLTSDSGTAITIAASNVTLYGNNATLTYADAGQGHAITLNTGVGGIDIYGFAEIKQGNFNGTTEKLHLINANTGIGDNIKVHDNSLTLTHACGGVNCSHVFSSADQLIGSNVTFYDNVVSLSSVDDPTVGGMSVFFIKGSGTGCRVFNNTVTVSDTQQVGTYSRVFQVGDGTEVAYNNVTISSSCYRTQVFSMWGRQNIYLHDNTVNDAGQQTRTYVCDGGSHDITMLWETYVGTRTMATKSDDGSILRVRYGAYNIVCGYCNFDASAATKTFGLRIGGHESLPAEALVRPRDVYIHHTTINTKDRNAISFEGGVNTVSSWQNTVNGGSAFDISVDSGYNGTPEGTEGSATATSNFQSKNDILSSPSINNAGGADNWVIEGSFTGVDVNDVTNITFGAASIFPVTTPNAPVARAI